MTLKKVFFLQNLNYDRLKFRILYFKNRFFCVNEINVIINIKISDKRLYFNFYVIITRYMLYNNYNQYITFKIDIVSLY